MSSAKHYSVTLMEEQTNRRLDKVLAEMFPEYSRNCLQAWLKEGYITVNGQPGVAKQKVKGDELVEMTEPDLPPLDAIAAEPIALNFVAEDEELLVIDKPAGLVVHPAVGNRDGTLQNALLHHYPELAAIPRAGIVHRLDKETSGLLVIARTLYAHKALVDQLQKRTVSREYIAITQGTIVAGGDVNEPIGRHQQDRKKMSVRRDGREAITHYRVLERYRQHTQLAVKLETGRTHQIRVHMAHIRKPLVGDPVYGGRLRIPPQATEALQVQLQQFRRQALHAARLGLVHPRSGEQLQWESPLPGDLQALINALREDSTVDAE